MFCSKCGAEISNEIQFCSKCGNAVNSTSMDTANTTDRKRHGFTSFWLIFSLITNAIVGATYLFFPGTIIQTLNTSGNLIMILGIISIIGIIGNVLLLCWKKIGFWIAVGISIVSLVVNFVIGLNIGQILFGLVGIVVLWGVLHIRKNGKTAWEQLI